MPRPHKPRRVQALPQVTYFKPTGIPMSYLEEIVLTVDELEALRLKDLEKLEQHDCAVRMNVAQSTLQRILTAAREKVTRAIVEGKALRIHGGVYALAGEWHCPRCRRGMEYFEATAQDICPDCSDEPPKNGE
ncbi:MAG TPA: DUF134 domain-containing protein [Bacillota bacterium]|nr:DUF134 domain-containing protein [Bacillota bacterium]